MRSLTKIRGHLFALLGGGVAVVAGVACGGSVETSSQPEGTGGGAGGTTATGTTGGAGGSGGTTAAGGGGIGGSQATGTGGTGGSAGGAEAGHAGGMVEGGAEAEADCEGPHDAGSTEPECVDYETVCFSAEAIVANLRDSPSDAGSCTPTLTKCPASYEFRSPYVCDGRLWGEASLSERGCCWHIDRAVDGRPFIVDGKPRCATAIERGDWCGTRSPMPDDLDRAARAALSAAWLEDAALEHASVASFARLSLHLLSLGAPPELLMAAERAAMDEIQHARRCFQMASRYAGRSFGPSPLAIEGAVTNVTFSELAIAAVEEGCVGETLAAVLAGERSEQASDPEVRAVLARIAKDETRHAELAWRTVKWAIEQGGPTVAKAVESAFAKATAPYRAVVEHRQPEPANDPLRAHGRMTPASAHRIACLVVREIVLPMAARLQQLASAAADGPLSVDPRSEVFRVIDAEHVQVGDVHA